MKNEILIHEYENFAPNHSRVKIPFMKLCTAQLPIKILGRKIDARGENIIFMHGKYKISMHETFMIRFIFSCMKLSYGTDETLV